MTLGSPIAGRHLQHLVRHRRVDADARFADRATIRHQVGIINEEPVELAKAKATSSEFPALQAVWSAARSCARAVVCLSCSGSPSATPGCKTHLSSRLLLRSYTRETFVIHANFFARCH